MPRNETYPLPQQQDSWGNCYDLPPQVYDRYFTVHPGREPLKAQVAKAICARCVILEECRESTLHTEPVKFLTGIRAGIPANQFRTARAWLRFEQGDRDAPPRDPRPEWLERSEAAETAEQTRFELEDAS